MKTKDKRLRSYRQIFSWLWKTWDGYRLQATINLFIGISLIAAVLTFVWGTKKAVDIATGQFSEHGLTWALILLVCVVVWQISMGIVNRWIRAVLGVRAQNRMQEKLFARLLRSDWMQLRHNHTGHLVNRLEQDVTVVVTLLTENLPSFIITCLQFLGAFFLLFYMDHELAVVVAVILPFFILCSRLYVGRMREISHEVRESESRVQTILQESLQHALIIKTLEKINFSLSRLVFSHKELRKNVVERTRYSSLTAALMNTAFATGYLLTFFWGLSSLRAGVITFGTLTAFIQLVGMIQQPVRTLTKFVPVFISAFTASERLMELEEYKEEERGMEPLDLTADDHVRLEVNNVDFTYEADDKHKSRKVLENWSAVFEPGSITAIVGTTGAGKTTVISLLLGLLHPQKGTVRAVLPDGRELKLTARTRKLFSYVPQGNTLLSGSIRNNLRIGNPHATDEEMREVLHIADADFVFDSPQGLDMMCSERGGGLSEGQAQRIGLARALLRKSPVLLLDEAFSSLDSKTAEDVLQHVLANNPKRTIIYITHREALMPYAQKIIRL